MPATPLDREQPVQPFFINLEPPRRPPSIKASPAPSTKAHAPPTVAPTEVGQPAEAAAGQERSVAPSGVASAAPGSGGTGSGPQATLKFDCMDGPGRLRAAARDPCLLRSAPRDHLPDDVVQQARIDADKAAFYERVLEARKQPGSPPFLLCAPRRKGPPHSPKLGPLPCWIVPPQGSLTPEIFVEPIPPKNPDHGPP